MKCLKPDSLVLRSAVLLTLSILCASPAGAGAVLEPGLAAVLRTAAAHDRLLVWVYLTDKGTSELQKLSLPRNLVSERALRRRANVLPADHLVDQSDLPLDAQYLQSIASRVTIVRNQSRWFNSVSVVATPLQIEALRGLSFVKKIDLVVRYRRRTDAEPAAASPPPQTRRGFMKEGAVQGLDYGASFGQVNLINVPPLHDKGNSAQGVLIGVFDNGFRLLSHQAFDSLRPRILATHDFVDHKESVVPNDSSPGFGSHGINTLSTLAGYAPGQLIGPAFGASFLLARTENDSSETPIEEDNWVAAVEWAESLGVQVTSTSLGYLTFDSTYTSLTWEDMDGKTALISRAATMAARKGVVVVNSAGNNHHVADHNTLDAPADADSIVTAGAVNPDGSLAAFSSRGPTVDGRIKPDVLAQGAGITAASSIDTSAYIGTQGTSFSCPLTAGVAALLLRDHPTATPMQILNALRQTASQASAPDNLNGWGIVNALAADNFLAGMSHTGGESPQPSTYVLYQNFPNPFNPGTTVRYTTIRHLLSGPAHVTLRIYDVLGQLVSTLVDAEESQATHDVTWDGTNARGLPVSSGVYFYRLQVEPPAGGTTTLTNTMLLVR